MNRRARFTAVSGIAGRDDRRGFDHENHCTLGSARAVNDALRHDVPLLRSQIDGAVLEVNDETAVENKEELVVVVVFMPMILAAHDAQANDRVVHFAQRLVIPSVGARSDQRRNVDYAQLRESNVEIGGIRAGVRRGIGHGCGLQRSMVTTCA